MKTLTFLGYYEHLIKSPLDMPNMLYALQSYQKVVSLPFTKESVGTLFEVEYIGVAGTFSTSKDTHCFVNDYGTIAIWKNSLYLNNVKNNTRFSTHSFQHLKTLDNFIDSCNRAGISISFKQEVTNFLLNIFNPNPNV